MNDRRPTELEIAAALRAHVRAPVSTGFTESIQAATLMVPQQQPLPSVLGVLTDADPVARRRAIVVMAAALLLAAVAGAAAVGALRLLETPPALPAGTAGRFAYVTDGDLYVANPDGTGETLAAHVDGAELSSPRWSGDGRWIAVQTPEPAILLVDLRTGDIRRIASGEIGDWSPDSKSLAYFTVNGDIAVIDVAGGTSRVLVARSDGGTGFVSGWGEPLAFSPDGRWLMDDTAADDPERPFGLLRIDVASGATAYLDEGRESYHYLADWAPDSRRVVLTVEGERQGSNTLWVASVDGSPTTEIREPDAGVEAPRWSPDGAWIAYILNRGDGREVAITRPDGTDRRTLAEGVDGLIGWSADGAAVAYTVAVPDEAGPDLHAVHVVTVADRVDRVLPVTPRASDFQWAITVEGAAGPTAPVPVAATTPDAPVGAPAAGGSLVPDATWGGLAFRTHPEGDFDCVVGVLRFPAEKAVVKPATGPARSSGSTGSGPTTGPQKAAYCELPFSPDGSAFIRADQLAETYEIVRFDGTTLAGPFPYDGGPPVWSTSGGWIARSTCDVAGDCSRHVIERPDGSERRELPGTPFWSQGDRVLSVREPDGTLLVGRGDGSDLHSIGQFPLPGGWAVDGSAFVFVRDGDAWLAGADGGSVRNLTSFPLGGATAAAWSPDGNWIAVLQGTTAWMMSPDGSTRHRVGTGLGGSELGYTTAEASPWSPAWSPAGSWAAIETTDHVVLVNTDDWRTMLVEAAFQPAWSQDGRFLAVVSGQYQVDVMHPDGSSRTTLATEIAYPPVVWLP